MTIKRIYNIYKTSYVFKCDICDDPCKTTYMQNYVIEEKAKDSQSIFSYVITRFGHKDCLMNNRIGKKIGVTKDSHGNECDVYEDKEND